MAEGANRSEWERMRLLGAITISPHVRKSISPDKLLPLPWDAEVSKKSREHPQLTAEESEKRFNALLERIGEKAV